eukprot:COSAG02_NODE_344_length_24146_cov_12.795983_12_plen_42_part_00
MPQRLEVVCSGQREATIFLSEFSLFQTNPTQHVMMVLLMVH